MATHTRDTLELQMPTAPTDGRGPLGRHWKGLLGGLVGLLAVFALMLWPGGRAAERGALLRMPPEERRALYEETRRNAVSLCEQAQKEPALVDRCEDAAAFLEAFPECDDACHAFGRAHRPGPTR